MKVQHLSLEASLDFHARIETGEALNRNEALCAPT